MAEHRLSQVGIDHQDALAGFCHGVREIGHGAGFTFRFSSAGHEQGTELLRKGKAYVGAENSVALGETGVRGVLVEEESFQGPGLAVVGFTEVAYLFF